MKIVRQSATELVVEENSLWITVLLALASLPLFYAGAAAGQRGDLVTGAFFLLCSLAWLRRSTLIFDAAQKVVRWRRMRFFRTSSGEVPFSDITGILTETSSGSSAARTYRLSIATPRGSVPMSDSYGGHRERYEAVRQEIVDFLKPAMAGSPWLAASTGLEASIRGLLRAGRRIDAVQLLRSAEHMDLTAAAQRVNQIAARMKAEQQK